MHVGMVSLLYFCSQCLLLSLLNYRITKESDRSDWLKKNFQKKAKNANKFLCGKYYATAELRVWNKKVCRKFLPFSKRERRRILGIFNIVILLSCVKPIWDTHYISVLPQKMSLVVIAKDKVLKDTIRQIFFLAWCSKCLLHWRRTCDLQCPSTALRQEVRRSQQTMTLLLFLVLVLTLYACILPAGLRVFFSSK